MKRQANRTRRSDSAEIGYRGSSGKHMEALVSLLQQCENDTRRFLGPLPAQRLGNWRKHSWSQTALVEYAELLLWGEHCVNGRKLDQQGGLSLERIVLDHLPKLFTEPDREQAKRTLGLRDRYANAN